MSTAITAQKTQVSAPGTKKTFQELVEGDQFKNQLAAALPKHLTAERFIRVLLTAAMKNPLLFQCTQESLFKGILDCAATGLEVDGRRAHLIPYKNNQKQCYEAQLIVDYKGIAELVMRSGAASSIHADIVCENDEFEYDRGEITKHKIDLKKDRGAMYATYTIIRMRDGGQKSEVMSKHEVDKIRARSKSGQNGPWVTDYNEMAKKTVFRRASKWVPLSPEIRNVVESEDAIDIDATDVPEKRSLTALIGADELPTAPITNVTGTGEPATDAAPAEKKAEATETKTAPAEKPAEKAAPRTYTPEERAAILKEVESLMLDNGVDEKKVLAAAKDAGLVKPGQDEVGSLDTVALDGLRGVIPTLKKK